MIVRASPREVIKQSLLELLHTANIEDITVTQIAKNCGITTRGFYYHFRDKHDVVAAIYQDWMRQFVDCPLPEWYDHMMAFFESDQDFFVHCIGYRGQNSLEDAIFELEWEKFRRHIKPEVMESELEYNKTCVGLEYMLNGNIALVRSSMLEPDGLAMQMYVDKSYSSLWELLSSLFPTVVFRNLSMEPVRG